MIAMLAVRLAAADCLLWCRIRGPHPTNSVDPRVYRRRLVRLAAELDLRCLDVRLPSSAGLDDVLATVRRLNEDAAVSGILVLRPLPPQVSEVAVFRELSPAKDIEAVHRRARAGSGGHAGARRNRAGARPYREPTSWHVPCRWCGISLPPGVTVSIDTMHPAVAQAAWAPQAVRTPM